MNNKEKVSYLLSFLDEMYPNAHCELNYTKDYELVIAVMLSAQTTDASVNRVTNILFNKYKTLNEFRNANILDIENIIQSLGLYKNKAKNIIAICNIIHNQFFDKLPFDKKKLMLLPGVGNKTAGVIRAELFAIADLPVDTHILRVSKRLKFVNESATPIIVEKKLKSLIDKDRWILSHHQLIFFGRYFCKAKNPNCDKCKLRQFCTFFKNISH